MWYLVSAGWKTKCLGPTQGREGRPWADENLHFCLLFPYSFFAGFWEFSALIAKHEISQKEKLLPNLNHDAYTRNDWLFDPEEMQCVWLGGRRAFVSILLPYWHVSVNMRGHCTFHTWWSSRLVLIPPPVLASARPGTFQVAHITLVVGMSV